MKHVLPIEVQPSELSLHIIRMMAYKNLKTRPSVSGQSLCFRCGLA